MFVRHGLPVAADLVDEVGLEAPCRHYIGIDPLAFVMSLLG
jgi:hypothetical protein